MKETRFIEENKKKWAKFEKMSQQQNYDAEELSKLYVEITDDLSYAQTKYPKRAVRVYLNKLAHNVFNSVYKKKKKPLAFFKFWVKTLPLELFKARRNLLVSLIIFIVALLIGIVSQEYDHSFARIILSDFYVDMTEANIDKGNPLAVYQDSSQMQMFLSITKNNIQVALTTFVLGVLFSVGTFYILLINGIMVGAFQWFFKTKGLLLTAFLGIWIHGAFEITSIVIAGGAGITMGNGLLFPDSLTRIQSLIISAKRGLRIMLGLFPFIIMAGFFESYVTRHYQTIPDGVKWAIIIGSFLIMIFYFGVYPFIANKKWGKNYVWEEEPSQSLEKKVSFVEIKNVAQVVADGFFYYRKKLNKLISPGVYLASLLIIFNASWVIFNYWDYINYQLYWNEIFSIIFGTQQFFNPLLFLSYGLAFTFLIHNILMKFKSPQKISFKEFLVSLPKKFIPTLLVVLITMSVFWLAPYGALVFILLLFPFIMYALPAIYFKDNASYVNVWSCFSLGGIKWSNNVGVILVMTIIFFVFFQVIAGLRLYEVQFPDLLNSLIVPLVGMHISTLNPDYWAIINIVKIAFYLSFIILIIPLLISILSFGYFSNNEYESSDGLAKEFEKFGNRSKTHEDYSE